MTFDKMCCEELFITNKDKSLSLNKDAYLHMITYVLYLDSSLALRVYIDTFNCNNFHFYWIPRPYHFKITNSPDQIFSEDFFFLNSREITYTSKTITEIILFRRSYRGCK